MLFILGLISSISTIACLFILAFSLCIRQLLRKRLKKARVVEKGVDERISIGFFHPYCNAGGGGERVLWTAIKALSTRRENIRFIVYTGDTDVSPQQIVENVKSRFNISLDMTNKGSTIEFIYLHRRRWVEADKYPHFTLLGQSIGSIVLGLEAIFKFLPDIYVDTMGYAFTLPLFKYLGGCKIGCYVHYPTISNDMLKKVSSRVESYNNQGFVAQSSFLSYFKLIYYKIFAYLYGWAGNSSDIVMVNSSWTEEHINTIWDIPSRTFKVFPPVIVDDFKQIPLRSLEEEEQHHGSDGEIRILSIAQFRPEKDYPLQLRSLFQLRQIAREKEWDRVRLILVGSCRNSDDQERVKDLQDLAKHLSLENQVEFKVNLNFDDLKKEMQRASIGIHTMFNEHFGIGIVESLAAGMIMVANRSGGPQLDIIMEGDGDGSGGGNGFLASDEAEYSETILQIIRMTSGSRQGLRRQARASAQRFSEKNFEKGFLEAFAALLPNTNN